MSILGPLIVYSPGLIMLAIFLHSYMHEPRQFRNAIYLFFTVMLLTPMLLMQFGQEWMLAPLVVAIVSAPVIVIGFLLINTVVVVRHEGLHLSTLLPALMAGAIVGWALLFPLAAALNMPNFIVALTGLVTLEGLWFFMTFVALLMYSTLYRVLPKKRVYDFIIIHGAGLMGEEPTPLLRGRIDKAVDLWEKQGKVGKLIASGGQGSDEVISEAEAMTRYMISKRQVPADAILQENRSTTTMENIQFSAGLIANYVREFGVPQYATVRGGKLSRKQYGKVLGWLRGLGQPHDGGKRRCALVTSDYHVFRACEYAHSIGLNADGVGSHTRAYYWPTAFIREFIAVTKSHLTPYIVIAILWAIPMVVSLLPYIFSIA